jgi:hypothetical protein
MSDKITNEIFREIIQKSLPNKVVTNFIAVAESTDGESSQLSLFVSDSMSPWLAAGMLNFAIDIVAQSSEDMDGD